MFFVLYLAILLDNMIASMIPMYSNIFAIFALLAEIMLVSSYINQQREIKRNAAVLKRQVREKTVFISEINPVAHRYLDNSSFKGVLSEALGYALRQHMKRSFYLSVRCHVFRRRSRIAD